MKNFKAFLILILFVSLSVAITSCKDEDNPTSSSGDELFGTWVLTKVIVTSVGNMELSPEQIGISVTIEMKNDHTFKATAVDSSGTDIQTGTWTAANGKVTLKGTDGTTQEMPYTYKDGLLTIETILAMENFGEVPVKMVFKKN